MKFTTVKKVAKKLEKFLVVAYRARNFLTKNQMITFYNAYLKPKIGNGLLIYGNTYNTHLNEIYKTQKKNM